MKCSLTNIISNLLIHRSCLPKKEPQAIQADQVQIKIKEIATNILLKSAQSVLDLSRDDFFRNYVAKVAILGGSIWAFDFFPGILVAFCLDCGYEAFNFYEDAFLDNDEQAIEVSPPMSLDNENQNSPTTSRVEFLTQSPTSQAHTPENELEEKILARFPVVSTEKIQEYK